MIFVFLSEATFATEKVHFRCLTGKLIRLCEDVLSRHQFDESTGHGPVSVPSLPQLIPANVGAVSGRNVPKTT